MSPRSKDSTENAAPFTREEIVYEVKRAALAMASLIAHFGSNGSLDHAAQYLGVEMEEYELFSYEVDNLPEIPIESHFLYTVVMGAYDYAYQVGRRGIDDGLDLNMQHQDVDSILVGFPHADWHADPSPLDPNNPSKLRQVLETFIARIRLDLDLDLTVKQLALLASMTEPAVRTSLSSAGIKTVAPGKKGDLNYVPHADALKWLMGRRGFIPSAPNDLHAERVRDGGDFFTLAFTPALQKAMTAWGLSVETLAAKADVPPEWLQDVAAAGATAEVDLPALERVAEALRVPAPLFVGKAVTELMSRPKHSRKD